MASQGASQDQDVPPTGEQAWQSVGVKVEGSLLTSYSKGFCGSRYLKPFSPEYPYFEIELRELGEQNLLGFGVVWENYGCDAMPGLKDGTVGYHIRDGKIFGADNSPTEKRIEDHRVAQVGDRIGCELKFHCAENGNIPIFFTLNGERITDDGILMEFSPNMKPLYPYIGMGHEGIIVSTKMYTSEEAAFRQLLLAEMQAKHEEEERRGGERFFEVCCKQISATKLQIKNWEDVRKKEEQILENRNNSPNSTLDKPI